MLDAWMILFAPVKISLIGELVVTAGITLDNLAVATPRAAALAAWLLAALLVLLLRI